MNDYGAILIDPPWSFKTFSDKRQPADRCAENHHTTLKAHELAGLPVPDLAATRCALFMWAVDSHLYEAIDLMRWWGFKHNTIAFLLKKETVNGKNMIGMGYWTRKQGEICLLGTRGTPARRDKGVCQLIEAPRREHSRKPDEQYERIERLVDGPYLEMFARQQWVGWDVWGDQTDKFDASDTP